MSLYADYRGGFVPDLPPAEFLAARKHGRRIVLASPRRGPEDVVVGFNGACVLGGAVIYEKGPLRVLYMDMERLGRIANGRGSHAAA